MAQTVSFSSDTIGDTELMTLDGECDLSTALAAEQRGGLDRTFAVFGDLSGALRGTPASLATGLLGGRGT